MKTFKDWEQANDAETAAVLSSAHSIITALRDKVSKQRDQFQKELDEGYEEAKKLLAVIDEKCGELPYEDVFGNMIKKRK